MNEAAVRDAEAKVAHARERLMAEVRSEGKKRDTNITAREVADWVAGKGLYGSGGSEYCRRRARDLAAERSSLDAAMAYKTSPDTLYVAVTESYEARAELKARGYRFSSREVGGALWIDAFGQDSLEGWWTEINLETASAARLQDEFLWLENLGAAIIQRTYIDVFIQHAIRRVTGAPNAR